MQGLPTNASTNSCVRSKAIPLRRARERVPRQRRYAMLSVCSSRGVRRVSKQSREQYFAVGRFTACPHFKQGGSCNSVFGIGLESLSAGLYQLTECFAHL